MDPVIMSALATVSIACSEAAQALIALRNQGDEKKLAHEQKDQLQILVQSLLKLEQTGELLAEAKRLHDCLQRVQTLVHRMASQYERALFNRIFHVDKYDVGRVCEYWAEMELEFTELELFLINDMSFFGSVISNSASERIYEGEAWAVSILNSREKVNRLVRSRERGAQIGNAELADEVNVLNQYVHVAVMLANREIRESASEISRAFLLLCERLKHVSF